MKAASVAIRFLGLGVHFAYAPFRADADGGIILARSTSRGCAVREVPAVTGGPCADDFHLRDARAGGVPFLLEFPLADFQA